MYYIYTTEEVVDLVTEYITEKVVGQTSYADCLHIALATIYRADYLISWNFKHIVNVQRIRGYNAINLKNGYKLLEIRSTRDFVTHEDNETIWCPKMPQQREDLSKKLAHMTKAEIVAYFQSKESLSKVKTHTPPQKFH